MVTTRNRSSQNEQSEAADKAAPLPTRDQSKGSKRKRKNSDPGDTNEPERSRSRLDGDESLQQEVDNECRPSEPQSNPEFSESTAVCTCRNDVMKCIGILPSLPIMYGSFSNSDSDDSDSDIEDYHFPVLPTVERGKTENHDG